MSSYARKKTAFRASNKSKYSSSKRSSAVSAKRSVSEIKRIALSVGETKYRPNLFSDTLDVPNYHFVNGIP